MTQGVAQILEEAEQLSAQKRAEFADRIVEGLALDIPPDIAQAQITEVRRRIAQVEAGEVTLAHIRQILASACATKLMATSYSFHPEALFAYAEATNYLREASPWPRSQRARQP